jgi:hypothetical protein
MRISSVKSIKFKDGLARKRRQRFFMRAYAIFVGSIVCIVAIIYAIFYSGWFDLNKYEIAGTNIIDSEAIKENLNTYLDYKFMNFLPVGRNILFIDNEDLERNLFDNNDLLKTIQIEKRYWHALSVIVTEREALGVWCFENYVGDHKCRYFDRDMKTWGDIDKTSGFVLPTIDDFKTIDNQEINSELFDGVMKIINGLRGIATIGEIQVKDKSIGDMVVIIDRPFYLKFSLESDLADQLEVLKIFLNNKKDDTTFLPQYLDLRVDGRVYYK